MDTTDVIEAFVDGEPVDPARLTAALSEPEGRHLLVDLLVLRGLVLGHDVPARPAAPVAHATQTMGRWRLLSMAAGLAAVSIVSGYLVGVRATPHSATGGVGPAASPVSTMTTAAAPSAPAPTHVIHLSNGVDWDERAGGN